MYDEQKRLFGVLENKKYDIIVFFGNALGVMRQPLTPQRHEMY